MSAVAFYPLLVKKITRETNDCVSIQFDISAEDTHTFQYQAGQYLTFKHSHNNEEIRRSYSICSAPHENKLVVAVKQVPDGIFSTYANTQLKPGDTLLAMPPAGNFIHETNNTANNQYLAFGAGSGITPLLGIIKSVLKNEPESTFTLVYGNKAFQSIIFREELEAMKNKFLHRLQVIHILSRERLESEINYGRINAEKCDKLCEHLIDISKINKAFICGPEPMTLEVRNFLLEKGMPKNDIKLELFTTASANTKKEKKQNEKIDPATLCDLTIKVDDRTFEIKLPFDSMNILDAALQHGADLPYACKGGVCCTCRARVVEGQVEMDVNYALEDAEVEQGYILTCQAHPRSNKVVVDFDVS